MKRYWYVVAVGLLVVVAVIVAVNAGLLSEDTHGGLTQADGSCLLVLGSTGLHCGPRRLAAAKKRQLGVLDAADLRHVADRQSKDVVLLVRSEVPYQWLRETFRAFQDAGIVRFGLLLEDSVCGATAEGVEVVDLAQLNSSINARRYHARIEPRSSLDGDDGSNIVRIQPFGMAYEIQGTDASQFTLPNCDKEMFTFCWPTASPKAFLDGYKALRAAAQQQQEPLGNQQHLNRKRVALARTARNQYPLETMRGQLRDDWPGVQLEVLDEIPIAIVLETIDSLLYRRSSNAVPGYTENVPNDIQRRCQEPPGESDTTLMLVFSGKRGVIVSEAR